MATFHITLSDFLNENNKTRKKDITQIMRKLKTKKAFDILDESEAHGSTFQYGGCWILADALSIYYDLPIYIVYNDKYDRIEHFVVQIQNDYIDSDGLQSSYTMLRKLSKEGQLSRYEWKYDIDDLSIIKYDNQNHGNIVKDLNVSKKLVEYFDK